MYKIEEIYFDFFYIKTLNPYTFTLLMSNSFYFLLINLKFMIANCTSQMMQPGKVYAYFYFLKTVISKRSLEIIFLFKFY